MRIRWSRQASADLGRLRRFIEEKAPDAAGRVTSDIARGPRRLADFPRIGHRLAAFAPREVRRLVIGRYEIRYEIIGTTIRILRVFHEREHRAADAE